MLQTLYRTFILPVQDIIYPPVCLTCDERIEDRSSKICPTCTNSLKSIDHQDMTWCEIKSKFDDEGVVDDIISCFLFEKEGKLQEIIHLLKYRGFTSVGVELGKFIGAKIAESPVFSSVNAVIPVPLHGLKRRVPGRRVRIFDDGLSCFGRRL